tara:strand:+ start:15844 stop:16578 length:735 start_codon:yes stop_codon:yes gene_type:complete
LIIEKATIITARYSSSRYPGKILENITNKYKSIDILIKRAKKIKLPIILATSSNADDDRLCNYVKKKYNILIFRGSKKDKIKRWHDCFYKYKIHRACMIDGDDLCFDFNLYKNNLNKKGLVASNKKIITGIFTNIIESDSLKKIYKISRKNKDTEMIEPFISRSKIKKNYIKIKNLYLNKKIRLTFDYNEDLILLKIIFKNFKVLEKTENFVKFLKKNNHISKINYFREANWKKNQRMKIELIN